MSSMIHPDTKYNNNNNFISNEADDMSRIEILFRSQEYFSSWYTKKEEIVLSKTISKIYAYTNENNFTITITRYSNIVISQAKRRWENIIKWVEENLLWVENLWLEQESPTAITLYIAEYTKATYRNDFNLITLAYYWNEKKGVEWSTSISMLINLLKKLNVLHKSKHIAHLNLNPSNIYYNRDTNDIYFGPGWINEDSIKDNNFNNGIIWYMSPEWCYVSKMIIDDLSQGICCDIWSVGCMIAEFFFIVSPLFMSFSQREKMKKIIEIIGWPNSNDIDYMTQQEYNILRSTERMNIVKGRWSEIFEDSDNNTTWTQEGRVNALFLLKKKMFEIWEKCLVYNRNKRISIDEMIYQIEDVNDRYVKAKPTRRGIRTIINRENLWKANEPIGNVSNESDNLKVRSNYNYKNKKENSFSRKDETRVSPLKTTPYNNCNTYTNKEDYNDNNTSFISNTKYANGYETTSYLKSNINWYNHKPDSTTSTSKPTKWATNSEVSKPSNWGHDKEIENWNEKLDDLVNFINQMKSSHE